MKNTLLCSCFTTQPVRSVYLWICFLPVNYRETVFFSILEWKVLSQWSYFFVDSTFENLWSFKPTFMKFSAAVARNVVERRYLMLRCLSEEDVIKKKMILNKFFSIQKVLFLCLLMLEYRHSGTKYSNKH